MIFPNTSNREKDGKMMLRLLLMIGFSVMCSACATQGLTLQRDNLIMTQRDLVFEDGFRVRAEEGLLFVPENREAAQSRRIAVYFVRIPARSPSDRSPVIYIPGGPGTAMSPYSNGSERLSNYGSIESDWGRSLLDLVGVNADLVFFNHRGALNLPFSSNLTAHLETPKTTENATRRQRDEAYASAVTDAQRAYKDRDIDVSGYNIIEVREDLEDLRNALEYQKVVLLGGSFGSQLSLAYLERYEENVDRAVLFGVEPLNHTYDSPAGVDAAIERVLDDAVSSSKLMAGVSETVSVTSLRRTKQSLNDAPVDVAVPDSLAPITVDGDDLAEIVATMSFAKGPLLERVSYLPKFVHEVSNGDYRYLAHKVAKMRAMQREKLVFPLIDNSIGVTEERDEKLFT